jgi:hypothetical protein
LLGEQSARCTSISILMRHDRLRQRWATAINCWQACSHSRHAAAHSRQHRSS